jgi:hypothetical protein
MVYLESGSPNPGRSIVSLHYIRLALIGLLLNQAYSITSHLYVELSIVIVINIVRDPSKFNSFKIFNVADLELCTLTSVYKKLYSTIHIQREKRLICICMFESLPDLHV